MCYDEDMKTLEAFNVNISQTTEEDEYRVTIENIFDGNMITTTMISPEGQFTKEQVFASLASGAIIYAEYDGIPPLPSEAVERVKTAYEFLLGYFTLTEVGGILAPPKVMEQRIFGSLI